MSKATIGAIWTGTTALVIIAAVLVLMLLVDFGVVAVPASAGQETKVVQGLNGIESAVNHLRGGFAGLGGGSLQTLDERLQGICNALREADSGVGC